jgi:hypothetical protein
LQLQWFKCADGEWCVLGELDVACIDGYGVFVIWRSDDDGRASTALYVGSGPLRHEIADCRRDPVFVATAGLRVTWAKADPRDVAGVAAYLYRQLRPLWGEVPRAVGARPVNLPLSA